MNSYMYGRDGVFESKICPVCGKKFFKPPESIYKYRDKGRLKYVCSYTCWVKKLKEQGKW